MANQFSQVIPLTGRQIQIMEVLNKYKTVHFDQLSQQFGCSISTIRRDVYYLQKNGLVTAYRGQVEVINSPQNLAPPELHTTRNWEEKNRIGKAAAELVSNGQVIGINAGTTAMALANHLLDRRDLTVVTADIEIAQLLITNPSFEVYVVGGQIQSEVPGVIGVTTLEMWKSFSFGLGFVGVRSISPKEGIMTTTLDQASSSRTVIEQSRQRIVLADSSKFHRRTGALISSLDNIDTIITDSGINNYPEILERLQVYKRLSLVIV